MEKVAGLIQARKNGRISIYLLPASSVYNHRPETTCFVSGFIAVRPAIATNTLEQN
jgi:hypothetical protein